MPHAPDVRSELTDILVQVVGCSLEDVVDHAKLADLGIDSLSIVEVADELGRRHDVYLADETVNGLRTVSDAVSAVVRHDGSRPRIATAYGPPQTGPAVTPQTTSRPAPLPDPRIDPDERRSALRRLGVWFAAAGAVFGIVLGLGGAALIGATGLDSSTLPPISVPTTPAPTTPAPTATPTPTPDPEETVSPDPTLVVEATQVSPGQRFTLQGAFPALDKGETLQVQVKDPGEKWDEFPVTTKTRAGGKYQTQIYTSRTGKRQFRMAATGSDLVTPPVSVTIG